MHEFSWFTTLTYAEEELPENGTLDPSHLRAFFKDLRRGRPRGSVSYFACGEYGDRTQRPHYHAVLFGPAFLDRLPDPDPTRSGVFRSKTLEGTWRRGIAELGSVTFASASYVAGYVRKKVVSREHPDIYTRVDPETGELVEVEPEFARMSLKPAIGRRWIEKYWQDVYPRDYIVVDGIQQKPPRYYDKWLEKNHPELALQVREKRYAEMEDVEPDKLRAAEAIHESRNRLYGQRATL